MADARKTWAQLDVLFGDNTAGAISPQDLRDGFTALEPHVAAAAPTASNDGTQGFDKGHAWINTGTTPHSLYKCLDGSTAAAVWVQVYPVTGSAAWGAITGTLADQTDLQAALDAKADTGDFATAAQGALADTAVQPGDPVLINAQTGTTYTLVLTDAGKLVTLTNAAAIALTVPTNAAVAFPVGTVIALAQSGAGTVTVAGDTGVTVNSLDAALSLAGQYATASLTKTATDTWLLSGGLA